MIEVSEAVKKMMKDGRLYGSGEVGYFDKANPPD